MTVEVARPRTAPRSDFTAAVRIDGPAEVEYYRDGGILQMVLRQMLAAAAS